MDETLSSAVLKGFQSLWLVYPLSNRLTLLDFQATAKTRSSFCPERKHWIDILIATWHTPRSQRCHSCKALRSSSPNFHCARRSRRWLRKKVQHILLPTIVASATPWPKTCRPRNSPESPSIMQTCFPGFPPLQTEETARKDLLKKNISTKCQSTTSTTWRKERTCMAHACRYQK